AQGRAVRFLTRGRKTRGIEEGPADLVVVARADTRGGHRETPPGDGQADQVVLEESCSEDRAVSAGGPEEEGKVTGSLVPRAHIPFTLTLPQGTGVFMSVWIWLAVRVWFSIRTSAIDPSHHLLEEGLIQRLPVELVLPGNHAAASRALAGFRTGRSPAGSPVVLPWAGQPAHRGGPAGWGEGQSDWSFPWRLPAAPCRLRREWKEPTCPGRSRGHLCQRPPRL